MRLSASGPTAEPSPSGGVCIGELAKCPAAGGCPRDRL